MMASSRFEPAAKTEWYRRGVVIEVPAHRLWRQSRRDRAHEPPGQGAVLQTTMPNPHRAIGVFDMPATIAAAMMFAQTPARIGTS